MIRSSVTQTARKAVRLHKALPTLNPTANRSFSSDEKKALYDVIPKQDFGAFKEYSVIFTNRSLNLMSDPFQRVMRDLNQLLKTTYNARKVAIIPG